MNHPAAGTKTEARAAQHSAAGFDLRPPSADQYQALTADLTSEEREVLLEHGTEAPFCGVFNAHKGQGAYVCRLCGLPLFRSGTKFESGTGWPSFFDPIDREHIRLMRDTSYGMIRTEIRCARCEGHLGHVFGPAPDRRALLHELRVHAVRAPKQALAGPAWTRRAGGTAASRGGSWPRDVSSIVVPSTREGSSRRAAPMPPFSVLDLAPVPLRSTPADALRNTLGLAQHAEQWGYRRYWLAEHHNMVGI